MKRSSSWVTNRYRFDYGKSRHTLPGPLSVACLDWQIFTTRRCQLLAAHFTLINRRELGRSLRFFEGKRTPQICRLPELLTIPHCIKQFWESFGIQRKIRDIEWPSFLWRYWVISISPVGDALPGVRKWYWWPSYTSYILILNLKALNEEPRNLKQYSKSQYNFGDTTKTK